MFLLIQHLASKIICEGFKYLNFLLLGAQVPESSVGQVSLRILMVPLMLAAEPPQPEEAVCWLGLASKAGHVRAQYQFALCLHQGCGVDRNLPEAVCHFFTVSPFSFPTYTHTFFFS